MTDSSFCFFYGTRCSETLRSIFENAVAPDDIKISIYDQIYSTKEELSCSEAFCKLVGEQLCRRSQIVSSQIDAANATVGNGAEREGLLPLPCG